MSNFDLQVFMDDFFSAKLFVGDCWEWQRGKSGSGYGMVRFPPLKKQVYVHRLSWELANSKDIPNGMHILHMCDNPVCYNPDHLRLGTNLENVRDSITKGRSSHFRRKGHGVNKDECIRGHKYITENSRLNYDKIRNSTYRTCKTCARLLKKKHVLE